MEETALLVIIIIIFVRSLYWTFRTVEFTFPCKISRLAYPTQLVFYMYIDICQKVMQIDGRGLDDTHAVLSESPTKSTGKRNIEVLSC